MRSWKSRWTAEYSRSPLALLSLLDCCSVCSLLCDPRRFRSPQQCKVNAIRTRHRRAHLRPGRWIVASQIALSLLIVITRRAFVRSFRNLVRVSRRRIQPPGSNVLLINNKSSAASRFAGEAGRRHAPDPAESCVQFPERFPRANRRISPVRAVSHVWAYHLNAEKGGGPVGDDADAYMNFISPGYFATLRSPIIAGRNFDDHDAVGAPPVIMINETMARRFFPGAQPVGEYLITATTW